jgi:DNA-binding transcriptional MerR regulator
MAYYAGVSESEPIYSIGAVSRMVGVATTTLRAWEDRYGVVVPERSEGSQRLYTRSQVRQLTFIQGSIQTGASAADAHRILAERIADGQEYVAPDQGGGVLVLLAERDPYAADLAEYFLRTEGYEVILALDSAEAEHLYEERQPAVVVLDLMISGGRGVALCEALAALGARVVAVSSVPQRERAIEAGADAFLAKPLDPLQLVSAVRDLLGTSALRTNEARPTR